MVACSKAGYWSSKYTKYLEEKEEVQKQHHESTTRAFSARHEYRHRIQRWSLYEKARSKSPIKNRSQNDTSESGSYDWEKNLLTARAKVNVPISAEKRRAYMQELRKNRINPETIHQSSSSMSGKLAHKNATVKKPEAQSEFERVKEMDDLSESSDHESNKGMDLYKDPNLISRSLTRDSLMRSMKMIDLERRREAALKVKRLINTSQSESESGSLIGAAQKANEKVTQLFEDLSHEKFQRVSISVLEGQEDGTPHLHSASAAVKKFVLEKEGVKTLARAAKKNRSYSDMYKHVFVAKNVQGETKELSTEAKSVFDESRSVQNNGIRKQDEDNLENRSAPESDHEENKKVDVEESDQKSVHTMETKSLHRIEVDDDENIDVVMKVESYETLEEEDDERIGDKIVEESEQLCNKIIDENADVVIKEENYEALKEEDDERIEDKNVEESEQLRNESIDKQQNDAYEHHVDKDSMESQEDESKGLRPNDAQSSQKKYEGQEDESEARAVQHEDFTGNKKTEACPSSEIEGNNEQEDNDGISLAEALQAVEKILNADSIKHNLSCNDQIKSIGARSGESIHSSLSKNSFDRHGKISAVNSKRSYSDNSICSASAHTIEKARDIVLKRSGSQVNPRGTDSDYFSRKYPAFQPLLDHRNNKNDNCTETSKPRDLQFTEKYSAFPPFQEKDNTHSLQPADDILLGIAAVSKEIEGQPLEGDEVLASSHSHHSITDALFRMSDPDAKNVISLSAADTQSNESYSNDAIEDEKVGHDNKQKSMFTEEKDSELVQFNKIIHPSNSKMSSIYEEVDPLNEKRTNSQEGRPLQAASSEETEFRRNSYDNNGNFSKSHSGDDEVENPQSRESMHGHYASKDEFPTNESMHEHYASKNEFPNTENLHCDEFPTTAQNEQFAISGRSEDDVSPSKLNDNFAPPQKDPIILTQVTDHISRNGISPAKVTIFGTSDGIEAAYDSLDGTFSHSHSRSYSRSYSQSYSRSFSRSYSRSYSRSFSRSYSVHSGSRDKQTENSPTSQDPLVRDSISKSRSGQDRYSVGSYD